VQAAVHPDLQLIGALSIHPCSQLVDRGCRPSAILLEHFQQRARPREPPSIGVMADPASGLVWHGVPSACNVDRDPGHAYVCPPAQISSVLSKLRVKALPNDGAWQKKRAASLTAEQRKISGIETVLAADPSTEAPPEAGR
jgi:hypothetical protein